MALRAWSDGPWQGRFPRLRFVHPDGALVLAPRRNQLGDGQQQELAVPFEGDALWEVWPHEDWNGIAQWFTIAVQSEGSGFNLVIERICLR